MATIKSTSIDLFSEEVRQDPFPAYEAVRRHGAVYFDESSKNHFVGRYADVSSALIDTEHFSSAHSGIEQTFMGAVENTDALRIRLVKSMLREALSTKRVRALEGAIADAAKVAVSAAVERGQFESRSALSAVVPAAMFRTMLGLDEVDTLRLLRWSDSMLLYGSDARKYRSRILSVVRRTGRRIGGNLAEASVREATEFLRGHFRANRDRYAEAWVANSMITVAESGNLDAEALVDLAMGFAVASAETSTSLINNAMNILARDCDLHEYMREGDEAVASYVEEVLRFASPVQRRPRVVRSACEIGGVALKEGDLVTLLIGSAHRDPEAFSEPDTFIPSRTPNKHLAFGMGGRSCPGSQLGRLEAQYVLSELVAQTRRVELVRPHEPLAYPVQLALRQPMNLQLRAIPS
jgi:hypothetical protein